MAGEILPLESMVHTNIVKIEVYGNRTIGHKKIKNAVEAANNPVNRQEAFDTIALNSDQNVHQMRYRAGAGGQTLQLGPTTIRIEHKGRVSLTEHHREAVRKSAFRDYYLGRGSWDRARAQRDGVDIDRLNLVTFDVEHAPEGQLYVIYAHLKAFLESQRGFCVVSGLPESTRTSRTGLGWRTNQVRLEDQERNRIVTLPLSRGGSTTNSEASSQASEASSVTSDTASDGSEDTVVPGEPDELAGQPVNPPPYQMYPPGQAAAAPQQMGQGRGYELPIRQPAVAPQQMGRGRGYELPIQQPAAAPPQQMGRGYLGELPGPVAWAQGRGPAVAPQQMGRGNPFGELPGQPAAARAEMGQGAPGPVAWAQGFGPAPAAPAYPEPERGRDYQRKYKVEEARAESPRFREAWKRNPTTVSDVFDKPHEDHPLWKEWVDLSSGGSATDLEGERFKRRAPVPAGYGPVYKVEEARSESPGFRAAFQHPHWDNDPRTYQIPNPNHPIWTRWKDVNPNGRDYVSDYFDPARFQRTAPAPSGSN